MSEKTIYKGTDTSRFVFFKIFSLKSFLFLFSLGTIIFILSMWHRSVHIDENWFGEQAYWLGKDGVVKIKSLEGILNFDEQMFVYHKLFVISGAGVVKLFGWSVYPLKAFSLVLYILFFIFYFKYWQNNRDQISFLEFGLASILIFVNPITMVFGFTFRPEIMVMVLGFISYFFLDRFLNNGKPIWLILGAVFSGLTFFTHLTGLIFPVAGFFMLLICKRYKAVGVYFIITSLVSLLYSYDLWEEGAFEAFIYEFKNYPILEFGKRQLSSGIQGFLEARAMSILTEHKRYLWSYYVFPLSVVFWLSYILNFKFFFKEHKPLMVFCTTLFIALAVLSSYKAQHYLIYFYPFWAIIAAKGILRAGRLNHKLWMFIYTGFFLLQIYYLHFEIVKVLKTNKEFVSKHAEVLKQVPVEGNEKIMVQWDFIFNEIENYYLINDHAYKFYQMTNNSPITQETYFQRASELGVKYIVYDQELYSRDLEWGFKDGVAANKYYSIIKQEGDFLILQRRY